MEHQVEVFNTMERLRHDTSSVRQRRRLNIEKPINMRMYWCRYSSRIRKHPLSTVGIIPKSYGITFLYSLDFGL